MLKVLAFDQSTKISAYSLWIDNQYIESGIVDLHKIKDTSERVRTMGVELGKIIAKYSPDCVVIEEVAQQSNALTLKLLARTQGTIIGFCAACDIKTYIVEPSKWRACLHFHQGQGVKREELKRQAIQYVKDVYGLDLVEDICESICIGEAAHKIFYFDNVWGEQPGK